MSIKLDDIDNKHPFRVPDGYFDKLSADIRERVSVKDSGIKVLIKQMHWAYAIPTMILMLAIGIWMFNTESQPPTELLLAEVSDDAILEYLESTDLSLEELASIAESPEQLFENSDYLQGIDLEEENLDDLMNTFDLNDTYL
ncbi:hypothetical protein [Marinoscillum sp. MHG1-6]|uniref:hypothetical protein n=1 Tax=Marinoscillum sp. MHG1-6 TaxID=2959627 RepID=UPI0021572A48|nr:hypothetical protein [Marinoscillum sp. MHG1-6]